ncbi:MAG TPA: hypothetical protein VNC40_01520 [Gaiellaceae bacterium]|nr:hypothetical protein [Gaiellaceae bacterium]
MATRGQTHNKRAREMALREKRERKQLKKDQRAAGLLPYYDDEGFLVVPTVEPETDGEAPTDAEQTETVPEAIQ